ncbi:593_t:CDS:2 [Scutellospora calospora]|uniref:593_t:CDS:1 n=1 Tax=Scutellospora calospora TaxID=85575 RepID=A0ACA9JWS9_9GLOM|nr:593_t:CDS:2 [Scutellospora calospora]
MTRMMKDLTKKDNLQKQNEQNSGFRCYACQKDSHISRDCPEKVLKSQYTNKFEEHQKKDQSSNKENEKQKDPNVRLVDFTKEELDENGKYLMVELVNDVDQSLAEVRNLGKRKQNDVTSENSNKRGRTQKVLEKRKNKETVINIPLSDMTENLDILKAIADQKLIISLEQLFKWSPKTRSKVMKALARKRREDDVIDMDVRLRLVKGNKMQESKNKIVPVWPALINSDLINDCVYGKRRIADDRISKFIGYIPRVEVKMEGVKTNQSFYIIDSASFDKEDDSDDRSDENDDEEINQVTAVRRFQIIENKEQTSNDKEELETKQSELLKPVVLQKLMIENTNLLNYGSNLSPEEKEYIKG